MSLRKNRVGFYRHGPKTDRLSEGACPHCGRVISPKGNRRATHNDGSGQRCSGSGMRVSVRRVHLDELPPVHIPQGGNPWSGRADIVRRSTDEGDR